MAMCGGSRRVEGKFAGHGARVWPALVTSVSSLVVGALSYAASGTMICHAHSCARVGRRIARYGWSHQITRCAVGRADLGVPSLTQACLLDTQIEPRVLRMATRLHDP